VFQCLIVNIEKVYIKFINIMTISSLMDNETASGMNVSFAGCGFLGLYHVGVACAFKTYAPHILLNKISGASAGSIAAVSLLGDIPLGEMTSRILQLACEARKLTLGPFSPSFNITDILYDGLNRVLSDDIHLKVQGRLHISLTKVYDGSNILVNQFANKEEVIQVILASCFIPLFSGFKPPTYRGAYVVDGGFSDNLPTDKHTVTVSPFSGMAHVCPDTELDLGGYHVSVANTSIEISKENLYRLGNVLLPPHPEVLSRVCKQGFEDALRYLQKRHLISCTRCLTIDAHYIKEEDQEEEMNIQDFKNSQEFQNLQEFKNVPEIKCKNHNSNCLECKLKREVAKGDDIPESVWVVFENAISEAEAGFASWLRFIPASRIFQLLTLPAAIPFNIASKMLNRLIALLPGVSHDLKLKNAVEKLIEHFCAYMTNNGYFIKHHAAHLAKYTCEFNITQYGDEEEIEPTGHSEAVKDLFSMELTAELETSDIVDLPHNQVEAIKFQNENLTAAVVSGSRMHSRVTSRATSRASSRAVSRMASRRSSFSSLAGLDEASPVLDHIRQVTQYQESLFAFYYTDEDNQMQITEIFDVTQTDPSLLTDNDSQDYSFSQVTDALHSYQDEVRRRHPSGMSRNPSGNTSDSFITTQGSWNSGSNNGGANKRGSDSSGASWEGGIGGRATSWDSVKSSPSDTPKLEARKPSFTIGGNGLNHEDTRRHGGLSPTAECSDPESDWEVNQRRSSAIL